MDIHIHLCTRTLTFLTIIHMHSHVAYTMSTLVCDHMHLLPNPQKHKTLYINPHTHFYKYIHTCMYIRTHIHIVTLTQVYTQNA